MSITRAVHINIVALKYFCSRMSTNDTVREYVLSRIDEETLDKWKLGYAPGTGGLVEALDKDGIHRDESESMGLIKTDSSGKCREVFYRRVVFPICYAGKLVAFAGRVVDGAGKQAKYINTKTTSVYDKKNVLYGLWTNRKSISERGRVLLVEGYFDILGLYSKGIRNVACIGGTSITESHILNLRRYTNEVGIVTDGDSAGEKSAKEIRKILAKNSVSSFIVNLPAGYDPDTYLDKVGIDNFNELVEKSRGE